MAATEPTTAITGSRRGTKACARSENVRIANGNVVRRLSAATAKRKRNRRYLQRKTKQKEGKERMNERKNERMKERKNE